MLQDQSHRLKASTESPNRRIDSTSAGDSDHRVLKALPKLICRCPDNAQLQSRLFMVLGLGKMLHCFKHSMASNGVVDRSCAGIGICCSGVQ